MDRTFDYSQKILVAVEISPKPRTLADMPPSYAVFQRLGIPEVMKAFDENHSLMARVLAGRKFHTVLDEHMGYWEKRLPAGQQCYVHYAIGSEAVIAGAFERLKKEEASWAVLGVYHMEAQSSSSPFAFPMGTAPNLAALGEEHRYTPESIFWFNFFPAQPYVFEKTFVIWARFNIFQGKEGGECNQLVGSDGPGRLVANGVDPFVQVNLNRFTSLPGYFSAAQEAGKHTFTVDPAYLWYGMLLRKL